MSSFSKIWIKPFNCLLPSWFCNNKEIFLFRNWVKFPAIIKINKQIDNRQETNWYHKPYLDTRRGMYPWCLSVDYQTKDRYLGEQGLADPELKPNPGKAR